MNRLVNSLPNNWRTVRFGDVIRHVKIDVDPETSGLERYIAGEHMVTDDLHLRSWGLIGDGYLGPAFHRKFVKGQVLYGSRRTYLRKVALADFDGVCANTTFVLEPSDDRLLPELLPFIMQTDAFNEHSVKQSKGSVNPYINFRDIAWYEFALPPLDEQRRIAEILWAADESTLKVLDVVSALNSLRSALMQDFLNQARMTLRRNSWRMFSFMHLMVHLDQNSKQSTTQTVERVLFDFRTLTMANLIAMIGHTSLIHITERFQDMR